MATTPRICQIVFAGIGHSDEDLLTIVNCDDGAYDLHDVVGTPADIGKAIMESLAESDMMHGKTMMIEDDGQDLYLTVKIKFSKCG